MSTTSGGRSKKSSGKASGGRLSGGSFKGRFISSPTSTWAKERFSSGDRTHSAASSSSSISSSSSSALSVPAPSSTSGSSPGTTRTSLNKIANSASNFQTYASRYIESIRPKSWGKTNSSGNLLAAPVDPHALGTRSAGNSRAESPLGGIPQLLTFRTPNRLSPLPPSGGGSGRGSNNCHHTSPKSSSPPSSHSQQKWLRHITIASNAYKSRDNSRRGAGSTALGGPSGRGTDHNGLSQDSADERGTPAGRSHSFHEQGNRSTDFGSSGSGDPSSGDRQTGSPTSEDENTSVAKKAGGSGSSSGSRKRLQRVEILKIAEPCPLIDPSQVVVTKGEILMAEPVMTPIENLKRNDVVVTEALEEKKRRFADILDIPIENFDRIADISGGQDQSIQTASERTEGEVLLAALAEANSFTALLNESLNLSDQDRILASSEVSQGAEVSKSTTPTSADDAERVSRLPILGPSSKKLFSISSNIHRHLTTLLAMKQERDAEREQLKQELQRTKSQVHSFINNNSNHSLSAAAAGPSSSRTAGSSATGQDSARPASFISVEEGSGGDQISTTASEKNHESEEDVEAPESNKTRSGISSDLPTPSTEVLLSAGSLDKEDHQSQISKDPTNISISSAEKPMNAGSLEQKVTELKLEDIEDSDDRGTTKNNFGDNQDAEEENNVSMC